ncbi:hypothetical protein [Pseudoteredinibacter isoporae]|uniref:Phosphoglycerol transferase MdoB-like AlkP superfamily enzyme n=1 Tax=Pseudoteredinibacter isoporae TaxID=570281 RepID=A0A7X0JT13_9GAMM|nr:hypothetical protein [Pseudoteredinibacter isoporae]MBB6520885.1 phosphoglycerol transferase MdoB-like AlkP superfamily enzyme [Pseudoteredinibacter isoporae]NHO86450.1 hypothetical protein [Pseudoteredinibacter isoporae]NIB25098.1 hypothetical protein [Pseudoteredinibacter isoporae]
MTLFFRHSLEYICFSLAAVHCLLVPWSFFKGHYVIPTIMLVSMLIFYRLAKAGLSNVVWVKKLLSYGFVVLCCHLFFALFHAKMPRELLQLWFFPVYASLLLLLLFLLFKYIRVNRISLLS